MNCEQAALLRLLIFIFVVIVNYFWIILSVDLIYLISTWDDHGVKLFRRKRNTLFIFLIQMTQHPPYNSRYLQGASSFLTAEQRSLV